MLPKARRVHFQLMPTFMMNVSSPKFRRLYLVCLIAAVIDSDTSHPRRVNVNSRRWLISVTTP